MVGGVAAGIARHLGVSTLWVRLAFVVLTWFNGAGVVGYLILWRAMPLVPVGDQATQSPGLESATRRGLRSRSEPQDRRETSQAVGMLALGVGVLGLLQVSGSGVHGALLIPGVLAAAGVVLVWRQFDAVSLQRDQTDSAAFGGVPMALRIGLGVALLTSAVVFLGSRGRSVGAVLDLVAAVAIAAVGVAVVLGPWVVRLLADLGQERRARIRTQERADVAAHLHDSVLQTLALLQANADDRATVSTLARRQERELRAWLYGADETTSGSWAQAVRDMCAEVEQAHRVPVEVVIVGDVQSDDDATAMLRAAREAVVNAARHSGATKVDVYAEVDSARLELFVRDRGAGFDLSAVPADRMGVRGSIIERMQRHRGSATIRSEPGQGTEVRLQLDRVDQEADRG